MQVIFLVYDTVEQFKGGTQLNNRMLVNVGRERGHDVSEMTLKEYDREKLKAADVVVLSSGMRQYNVEDIHWVLDNCKNVVRYDGDYGFCTGGNCICFGDPTKIRNCGRCSEDVPIFKLHLDILEKCKKYVFLSPAHREMTRKFFGSIVDKSFIYIPFYKDDKLFYDMKLDRIKNSVLWAGRFSYSKGLVETMKTMINHPFTNFFVCGKGNNDKDTQIMIPYLSNISNCTYLGDIDHDTMPIIYNLMEVFIFEGIWPDTGPGTILEAALCGCKISTSPTVATILSNNFKNVEDMRTRIRNSKDTFWSNIEELK